MGIEGAARSFDYGSYEVYIGLILGGDLLRVPCRGTTLNPKR